MSPLFIQLSPGVMWQMRIRHLECFCSQPSFPADYSCLAGTAAQGAGLHEPSMFNLDHPATASAGAPEAVTVSQPDLRHPVSFKHLLRHSRKAGFKSLDVLLYISLGSSWNACSGQAQLTCSCLHDGSCTAEDKALIVTQLSSFT